MDWYYDRGHVNFARGGSKKMNYKGEVVDELRPQPADRATAFKAFNKRQVKELITPIIPDIWWGTEGTVPVLNTSANSTFPL